MSRRFRTVKIRYILTTAKNRALVRLQENGEMVGRKRCRQTALLRNKHRRRSALTGNFVFPTVGIIPAARKAGRRLHRLSLRVRATECFAVPRCIRRYAARKPVRCVFPDEVRGRGMGRRFRAPAGQEEWRIRYRAGSCF